MCKINFLQMININIWLYNTSHPKDVVVQNKLSDTDTMHHVMHSSKLLTLPFLVQKSAIYWRIDINCFQRPSSQQFSSTFPFSYHCVYSILKLLIYTYYTTMILANFLDFRFTACKLQSAFKIASENVKVNNGMTKSIS